MAYTIRKGAALAAASLVLAAGFAGSASAQSRYTGAAGAQGAAWSNTQYAAPAATAGAYARPGQTYQYAPAAQAARDNGDAYVSPYARTQAAPVYSNNPTRYSDRMAQPVALSQLPGYAPPSQVLSTAPSAGMTTVPLPGAPVIDTSQVDLGDFHDGILIDISDRHLYWVEGSKILYSFQLGVPRYEEWVVYGDTKVTLKRPAPTWRPTPSMLQRDPTLPKEVGPGPDNPLGKFALNTGFEYIRIHGTNRPESIGNPVSSGCFRLPDEGIETIFGLAKVGTPVRIRA